VAHQASNTSMKPTAPIAIQLQCVCHDTVPWLISFSLGATRMTIFRLSLLLSILLLPSSFVLATSNYEYGPDEYVTVASGISPDGKYAITAHGSGYLGHDNFHLYLTNAASGKNIGPLAEVVETLDTGAMLLPRNGRWIRSK
jgi:hypothetical protein